jgi:hypoxanthine-guanine phosphoribosyltransferase
LNAGATAVAQAVLIRREGAGTFEPTFIGWDYNGPEWFVGYGMDDNGRHRNLADIYVIEK